MGSWETTEKHLISCKHTFRCVKMNILRNSADISLVFKLSEMTMQNGVLCYARLSPFKVSSKHALWEKHTDVFKWSGPVRRTCLWYVLLSHWSRLIESNRPPLPPIYRLVFKNSRTGYGATIVGAAILLLATLSTLKLAENSLIGLPSYDVDRRLMHELLLP
ncbi:hypothetical protein VNO77_18859 [Canavalia gladiata]|uniref:Uncharacterized protein n=1 Tax=Canavalia gladiata TaxID=3824 RepID=A0AAN9QI15_CANGL